MKQTLSVKKARKLLGEKAEGMTDEELEYVITTLHLMAKDALGISREKPGVSCDKVRKF